MKIDLLERLESGALVLTANKRLSRYLLSQYDSRQLARGVAAWQGPAILPFDSWCRRQYESLPDSLPVIGQAQGLLLWERIIEKSVRDTSHELLQVAPTAEVAWKAEQLLIRYRTSFRQSDATEDQLMFLQWQTAWRLKLEQLEMIDAASLPILVAESVATLKANFPDDIFFVGFDDIDPSVHFLQQQMERAGLRVFNYQPSYYDDPSPERYKCLDRQDEVRRCALTARQLIDQNPQYRIGVVAPNLKIYREQIETIFRKELDPYGAMYADDAPSLFNLSEAPSLADEPVVHAALGLLRINSLIDTENLAALLRSPFIKLSAKFSFTRAVCDRETRRLRRSYFRLDKLEGILEKFKCDGTFIELSKHLSKYARLNKSFLPGDWAEGFLRLLDAVGWPGERTLSSREYQAIERFKGLLCEFSSLDRVATPLKRLDAVSRLSRMATAVEFQPEGATSNINVIGMLEASGMQFDFLWILGLHAGSIPAKPHPNPFIPVAVQDKANMPHASAFRECAYAEKVLSRLFASAPEVVVSWPQMEEGMPMMMSRFVSSFPERASTLPESADPTALVANTGHCLERVLDSKAPPVTSRKTISGGTSIIKDQAICPFRAFAHHRLRAEAFEEADVGIDALTRGSLSHKVLELFWEKTKDQRGLLQLSSDELVRQVTAAVEQTVDNNYWNVPPGLRQIEIDRLTGLILKWLDVEKQRTNFEVIEREQEHKVNIGRLQIKTVIDRIDRLDNGQLAIIDYKTGKPDPAQWFEDRITEPQMPVYCQQIDPEKIAAVVFAVVRLNRNESRFRGIARSSLSWPGISDNAQQELMAARGWESFDQILENWRVALPGLGDAFMDGEAMVDPYDREKACRYCDLMPLCRLHEADQWGQEEHRD